MPSYTRLSQQWPTEIKGALDMLESIDGVNFMGNIVARGNYVFNREWLAEKLGPYSGVGREDGDTLSTLADKMDLPERCYTSLFCIDNVDKQRKQLFQREKIAFTDDKLVIMQRYAELFCESRPGSMKSPYAVGKTGGGKTYSPLTMAALLGIASLLTSIQNDDEVMAAKVTDGVTELKTGVVGTEMRTRAWFGVFDTPQAQLSFFRMMKKYGAGTDFKSHQQAFGKISAEEWNSIGLENGFMKDGDISGVRRLPFMELVARVPGGVLAIIDEFSRGSHQVQGKIQDFIEAPAASSRDAGQGTPMAYISSGQGVNTFYVLTDNPPGEEGHEARHQLQYETLNRLVKINVEAPDPINAVHILCRQMGHNVTVDEIRKRALSGADECWVGIDIPDPSLRITQLDEQYRGQGENIARTLLASDSYCKSIYGHDATEYMKGYEEDHQPDTLTSKLFTREQSITLASRIITYYERVKDEAMDPNGGLNGIRYGTSTPIMSPRTYAVVMSLVERQMQDHIYIHGEGTPSGADLAQIVDKAVKHIDSQFDYVPARKNTGTHIVSNEDDVRAEIDPKQVILSLREASGLTGPKLNKLFSGGQSEWVREDIANCFGGQGADLKNAGQQVAKIAKTLGSDAAICRISVGSTNIYLPLSQRDSIGPTELDAADFDRDGQKATHSTDIGTWDNLEKTDREDALYHAYKRVGARGGVGFQTVAAIGHVQATDTETKLKELFSEMAIKSGGEDGKWFPLDAKMNAAVDGKSSPSDDLILIPLGGGAAAAIYYAATKQSYGRVLRDEKETLLFLSDSFIKDRSPGFPIPSSYVAAPRLSLTKTTGKPITVEGGDGQVAVHSDIGVAVNKFKTHGAIDVQGNMTRGVDSGDLGVEESLPLPKSLVGRKTPAKTGSKKQPGRRATAYARPSK